MEVNFFLDFFFKKENMEIVQVLLGAEEGTPCKSGTGPLL
jgi:hypothetical protein